VRVANILRRYVGLTLGKTPLLATGQTLRSERR
jgi:hypothetical protein